MKNFKTPLLRSLRKVMQISQQSKKTGIPADELLDISEQYDPSRRDFLGRSIKAGALLSIAGSVPFLSYCQKDGSNGMDPTNDNFLSNAKAKKYSVAIVGGGIAGLQAAWVLKKEA